MRVLLVSPFPPPSGGIGRWAVQISNEARRRENILILPVDISPRWREVDDLRVWKRVIGGSLQLFRDFFRFIFATRFKPDVLHLNSHGQLAIYRDILILATCRLLRIPTVYHMRFGRIPEISRENTKEWRRLSLALKLANRIVAIDRRSQDALRKASLDLNVSLIPNCIDLSGLKDVGLRERGDEKDLYLMYLGHVIPTKGIRELIQAWFELDSNRISLRIVGPYNSAYKRELLAEFPSTSIEFVGELPHSDAIEMLANSEGLILPSYTEGFPNVVVEAMALGKAVLATNVGAIPDMLDGECGILIDPQNVDQLKDGILALSYNLDSCKRYGKNAQSKSHSMYGVEGVFDELFRLWQQVASKSNDLD